MRTVNILRYHFWLMLTQIGICNQNDETSVEELSHKKCLNESTVLS